MGENIRKMWSYKETIDDSKVKEAISSYLSKMEKDILDMTIKVSKSINYGTISVIGNLEDGKNVSMMVNLKDYSVMSYEVNYK
ncbi:hypothetical protein E4K67_16020 [Desulfosporosinus fructosivorans]|uniref:Uncharacterized protein n=1 Tax=Desulfosporosinus fructosivorans TaxID=2018669 RepID=A0A4Z0R462_9FIRM|nr:hypothetical protein [Desulfosporosinus fructosivorans]TGE37344.1 hypothetical protein E4K67_16020 [Desulfosporosinus fructosivorans]